MKTLSIPVHVVGPGSQHDEEPLQYLDFSRDVSIFNMPLVPDRVAPSAMREARALLQSLADALACWDPATEPAGPHIGMSRLSPAAMAIVDQMLGEGEVSIKLEGPRRGAIQESVFAGIWRVCELDADGYLIADRIEAATIPSIVTEAARANTLSSPALVAFDDGAMNSPAVLSEIADRIRTRRPGDPPHIINLTLFPLTPQDHLALEQALPVGPVAIMSRGFGNCRITSTRTQNVWRVQYFNNMNTLILNTLEIVETPEVALAAVEDLVDSRERLAELVEWLHESYPE